jgi:methionyl-tRNA formyltransferase
VTYATKVEPGEHHLDWSRPAAELHRVVRLGRAWTTFRGGRLLVLRASLGPSAGELAPGEIDRATLHVGTGDGGALALEQVQPEGRAAQPAAAWRNGARPGPGERLGA